MNISCTSFTSNTSCTRVKIRNFDLVPYEDALNEMRQHVDIRIKDKTKNSPDECWVLEHPPVFTQGQAGKPEHLLAANNIPMVQSDRGGQITYHGPGQLIIYFLLDIERKGYSIRDLVCRLEESLISFLGDHQIEAHRKKGAPGVYVREAKIGSIGLRIRRGISYHGLSFNVDMDLKPFLYINPCGFSGLKVVQLCDLLQPDFNLKPGINGYANLISYTKTHLIKILAKHLEFTILEH